MISFRDISYSITRFFSGVGVGVGVGVCVGVPGGSAAPFPTETVGIRLAFATIIKSY